MYYKCTMLAVKYLKCYCMCSTAAQQVDKQSYKTLLHSMEEVLPAGQFARLACSGATEEGAKPTKVLYSTNIE